jgi:SAM-dependent methyltransferase
VSGSQPLPSWCTPAGGPFNLYLETARFYDFDYECYLSFTGLRDDVQFYLEEAGGTRGEILDVACGTGRVLLPLAAAGYRVRGIDLSRSMLAELERKLASAPAAVAKRARFSLADMRDFRLGRSFSLAILPFNSFQALLHVEEARACLAALHRHLLPGGRLVISLNALDRGAADSSSGLWEWESRDPRSGERLFFSYSDRGFDGDSQIGYHEVLYRRQRPGGAEERFRDRFALKFYRPQEVRALLADAGFELLEELGDYDRSPLGSGPEYIFRAQRKA